MPVEIEERFLIPKEEFNSSKEHIDRHSVSIFIRQAYLISDPECTLRIRSSLTTEPHPPSNISFITVKGRKEGISCQEFEMEVSKEISEFLFSFIGKNSLVKVRYKYKASDGHIWEIDEFLNDQLKDIVIAEIELKEGNETFVYPPFLSRASKISYDHSFSNSALSRRIRKKNLGTFIRWLCKNIFGLLG